jgi:hypothetical protein
LVWRGAALFKPLVAPELEIDDDDDSSTESSGEDDTQASIEKAPTPGAMRRLQKPKVSVSPGAKA